MADEPKKIGYKIFKDGKEAAIYFRSLLNALTQKQDLNEVHDLLLPGCLFFGARWQASCFTRFMVWVQYEYHMVLELLKSGHPEPDKKVKEPMCSSC